MAHTTEITNPNPQLEDIAKAREIAEKHLADAKLLTDRLRVRHAQAILKSSFPDHVLAVFTRNWDEDEPKLLQLIGSGDVDDIDDFEEARVTGHISQEQAMAWAAADSIVVSIGSDDDLGVVLQTPDEEHDGWVEFDLALNDGADLAAAGVPTAKTTTTKESQ